jgi:hypothetical protein
VNEKYLMKFVTQRIYLEYFKFMIRLNKIMLHTPNSCPKTYHVIISNMGEIGLYCVPVYAYDIKLLREKMNTSKNNTNYYQTINKIY